MDIKLETKNPKNDYHKLQDNHQYSPFEVEEPPKLALKIIRLNPGISQLNFICCMIHFMIMIFGFAAAGIMQPLILLDKDYYNIGQENAGTLTSLVLVVQLVVKIIVSIPYGHTADRFGRKAVILYGAINYLASCLLVPLQTSIFPGFILAKALLANGASALTSVPLLADYVADESKGRASGISAMFIGIAAMFANISLKILFYAEVSLGYCYVFLGIFVFAALILNTFGLKGQSYYALNRQTQNLQQNTPQISLKQNFSEAIQVFKTNGWLMISLVLQVLGSSDFFVFFTFMTLYVKSLFPEGVDDKTANITVNNLQTLVMVPSFLCNMFYGYFLDKENKAIPMSLFALGGGAFSFILMSMSHTPYDWTLTFAALLLGATIPGLFVIAGYLGIKNFPADKRGIMIGFTGLVGYIGFFIIASGGGFLYDHWRKDGPFLICSGLLVLAIILVIRIYSTMIVGRLKI